MAQRDEQGNVVAWNSYEDILGQVFTYVWLNETQYLDFPIRCPKNGQCVGNIQVGFRFHPTFELTVLTGLRSIGHDSTLVQWPWDVHGGW